MYDATTSNIVRFSTILTWGTKCCVGKGKFRTIIMMTRSHLKHHSPGYLASDSDVSGVDVSTGGLTRVAQTVDYFSQLLRYTRAVKSISDQVAIDIEEFVADELLRYEEYRTVPLILIISLSLFVPVVAYITLEATSSMFK